MSVTAVIMRDGVRIEQTWTYVPTWNPMFLLSERVLDGK